jgi:hypothetical protein
MTRKGATVCGLCDEPTAKIIRYSAPDSLPSRMWRVLPAQIDDSQSTHRELAALVKSFIESKRLSQHNVVPRGDRDEILSALAKAEPENVDTETLQMAIFSSSSKRAADTGLFQLLLGHAMDSQEAIDRLDVVALVRTCLIRYNTACLDLTLPLLENGESDIIRQSAALGFDLYKSLKELAQMEGLREDRFNREDSFNLLNLRPERLSPKSQKAVEMLCDTFGLELVTFLVRKGFISVYGHRPPKRYVPVGVVFSAANSGVTEILQILRDVGSDLAVEDTDGQTGLHKARNGEIAKILLDAGCKVDALDVDKSTPLHRACGLGLGDVVRVLLDSGAKGLVNTYNKFGKAPIHYTAKLPEIKTMLIEAGADPELQILGRQ